MRAAHYHPLQLKGMFGGGYSLQLLQTVIMFFSFNHKYGEATHRLAQEEFFDPLVLQTLRAYL